MAFEHMIRFPRQRRHQVVCVFLLAAFATGAFFFGVGDNLAMLVATAAMLLIANSLVGVRSFCELALRAPWSTIFAIGALLILILNVHWSLSKDSSFGPAWVLAALPLTFLAASAVDARHRRWVRIGLTSIVCMFASISLVRLILYGERASLPLTDPNNYATLMYLAWIPFVHQRLVNRWSGIATPTWQQALEYSASFVMLAGLFATQSRTSSVIVAVVLTIWIVIGFQKNRTVAHPLAHAAIALLALTIVLLLSPPDLMANRLASIGAGTSIRMDLIHSGWQMFQDHPLTGVGVFCFSLLYGAYRPLSEQLTAGLFVHNDYVQLLAEGGVLLFLLPLGLLFAACRASMEGCRAEVGSTAFERVGSALAVGAACAHALVNFVFYTLPLAIMIGVLAASMLDRRPTVEAYAPTWNARLGIVGAIGFGWVVWLYLVLDLATVAIFQGQKGIPFSESVRSDPAMQLKYARIAQKLNGERGIPVLGEAMILARDVGDGTATEPLRPETLAAFRRAIDVDPWNPLGYIALAKVAARNQDELVLSADEAPRALLLKALSLDPVNVAAIDDLLALDAAKGRLGDSYAVLKSVVFPWIELLKRQDERAANRYLEEMNRLANLAGDTSFVAAVVQKRELLEQVTPKIYRRWFD